MRITRDDAEALVVRIPSGSNWLVMGRWALFIAGCLIVCGLVALFVLGRSRTLTCTREPATCELRDKGILDANTEVIAREQIVAVEVEQSVNKCRTKLRTRRGVVMLNPIWTVKCTSQRKNADEINAFLAAPRDRPLVIRFEERLMFVVYTTGWLGGGLVALLLTFWPAALILRIDRGRRTIGYRKIQRPWRTESRAVPVASVVGLSIEPVEGAGLRVAIALDDRSSVVVRTAVTVDPIALELARDRLRGVLAELGS